MDVELAYDSLTVPSYVQVDADGSRSTVRGLEDVARTLSD
jgi:hypothetical protein